MEFHQTKLKGVFEITPERKPDERGFFARTWCQTEFAQHGLNSRLVQCSISFSPRKGTLRGMHYQVAPSAETKLIRCTQGAIYDVIVDLRPNSPTFKQWIAAPLTAENRKMIFVPEGCAHGFITQGENSEVFYQMSEFYSPDAARGVRYDDPAFAIVWPERVQVISERDRTYPDFA
ncbi:MAG TPA: dTDP-4-dehydrorhamnose 3,5-epimerase [Candidatus Acidoferrum sp.]|jgi:dTDP-4-dehydrorhamnose 3,5-epimerase